jgi:hypothetical protein
VTDKSDGSNAWFWGLDERWREEHATTPQFQNALALYVASIGDLASFYLNASNLAYQKASLYTSTHFEVFDGIQHAERLRAEGSNWSVLEGSLALLFDHLTVCLQDAQTPSMLCLLYGYTNVGFGLNEWDEEYVSFGGPIAHAMPDFSLPQKTESDSREIRSIESGREVRRRELKRLVRSVRIWFEEILYLDALSQQEKKRSEARRKRR